MTATTTPETICREFAQDFPTPAVEAAIANAERGDITWLQVEVLLLTGFAASIAEAVAPARNN